MISKGICNIRNVTLVFLNYQFNTLAVLDVKRQAITGKFGSLANYLLGEKR